MKLLVLILTFTSIAYALEDECQGANLISIHEKCMLANGGDRVVIDELIQFKPTDNENSKCFRDCIMRECNYLDSDDKLNPDVPTRLSWVLHGGDESNVQPIEEAAEKCVALQTYGPSQCDNAESFARCLIQESPVKLKLFNVYD